MNLCNFASIKEVLPLITHYILELTHLNRRLLRIYLACDSKDFIFISLVGNIGAVLSGCRDKVC